MLEFLSDRLSKIFYRLSSRGRLSEKDIDDALRQIRLALLEADVNFKVVKEFTAKVRGRCVGIEVLQSLTPTQQIIKIVNEELIAILGGARSHLVSSPQPPSIAMLVGLQGCGKTTTALSILRLIDNPPGRIVGGEILYKNIELLKCPGEQLRHIRGSFLQAE